MRIMSALRGWLTLSDYDAEREAATTDIVARFSRGNVSVQNGQILDDDDLRKLSIRGERSLAGLNRLARRQR